MPFLDRHQGRKGAMHGIENSWLIRSGERHPLSNSSLFCKLSRVDWMGDWRLFAPGHIHLQLDNPRSVVLNSSGSPWPHKCLNCVRQVYHHHYFPCFVISFFVSPHDRVI